MASKPDRVVINTQGQVIFAEIKGRWLATDPEKSTREVPVFDPKRASGDVVVNFAVRREGAKILQMNRG